MEPVLTPNAWLRWDVIRRELRRVPAGARVLEIGMGGGAVGARLSRRHRYTGVEPDERSRDRARTRLETSARVLDDVSACGASEVFDVVCSFEVLEHIEDDAAGLEAVRIDNIGFPVGNLLEVGRNVLARRRRRGESATTAERTASSGRFLQPPDAVGPVIAAVMAPARLAQRPFRRGERGPGWVAVARRRAP